jgi:hypothetical protein
MLKVAMNPMIQTKTRLISHSHPLHVKEYFVYYFAEMCNRIDVIMSQQFSLWIFHGDM